MTPPTRWTTIALLLATALAQRPAHAADRAAAAGPIADFSLCDANGRVHALSEFADREAVVVAFLGVECPLALLYAPRLAELAAEFADRGVAFVAIDSNRQDSLADLAAFVRQHALPFPLLKDPDNAVADRFGAQRTPEVFVLDRARNVRYRGRIDDQYGLGSTSGYAKTQVNRRDLAIALEELLAGRAVSQPATVATGCLIGRIPQVEPRGEVTYARHIAPLLQAHCVECHRPGEVAPFPLTAYEEVVGWAEMIREVVDQGRMPPWFADPAHGTFANDARLSGEEKHLLAAWVENGCPEGDLAELPEPRVFSDGWRIPEPDLVVYMDDKPYAVPADGVVDYQYFTVDPGFTEDKWLMATEARPGNRKVVHHIIVFAVGGGRREGIRGGGGIAGYAPGKSGRIHPEGVATLVPAGSKLVFQMHYTPNGTQQQDRSYVGLKFADPATVRKQSRGGAAINFTLQIPPGADNHQVSASHKFGYDTLLYSLSPHMHVRGKSFRYEALYPDGRREILLDIPRYDFNWQLTYEFAEPRVMPAGTRLQCIAHFDNSTNNPANPDPTATVRWGDQTWDEMMIGFFGAARVDEDRLLEAGAQVEGVGDAAADRRPRGRNIAPGSSAGG